MNIHVRHPDEVLAPTAGGADHRFDNYRYSRVLDFLADANFKIGWPANSEWQGWLDLGCHHGEFLKFLDIHVVKRLHGCDNWIDELLGPWTFHYKNLEYEYPDLSNLDVVSALEVIEHITDTDLFLEYIHESLKPGGWLLLSTPNINSLRNRITVPLGIYPDGPEYRNVIHHVRMYNPKVMVRQLHDAGFTNCRVRGVAFLPLSSGWGTGRISQWLADRFPSLCNNFIVIAQKGA